MARSRAKTKQKRQRAPQRGAWAEDVDPRTLIPWSRNPRIISDDAVQRLATSIRSLGWGRALVARRSDRRIIVGHRTQRAALVLLERGELPGGTVPVRWVEVDDARATAMALADNRLAEDTDWDYSALGALLAELEDVEVGFDASEVARILGSLAEPDTEYSKRIVSPVYKPTEAEPPPVASLVDVSRSFELQEQIEKAELPDDVRAFLRVAAARHNVFDYRRIAEFYAHASADVQQLMERSALVIIDFEQAIESGFVVLSEKLAEAYGEDEDEQAEDEDDDA